MSKGRWKRNRSKHEVDRTQCRKCLYKSSKETWAFFSCSYIFLTGQRRPCEPSPNCTAFKPYKRKERLKMEAESKQKFVTGKV